MTPFKKAFARGLDALEAAQARFAMIGGVAVSVRAEPRFTKDVDFIVAVASDEEAERLGSTMLGHGFSLHTMLERTDVAQIATMRFILGGVLIDLLVGACGAEQEIVELATPATVLKNRECPVASVGALLALKTLAMANRKKIDDEGDMLRLLAVANDGDVQQAEELVALMTVRGPGRDKGLAGILARVVASAREQG